MFTLRTNLSKHIRNAHISDSHTHQCRDATQMGAQLQPTVRSTVIHWSPPAPTSDVQQLAIQPVTVAATGQVHTTLASRVPTLDHLQGTATTSTATVYGGAPSLMPWRYSEYSIENNKIQKDSIQSVNMGGFIEIDSSLQRMSVWYFRKNFYNITSFRIFLHSIESELIEKLRERVGVHPIQYDLKLEATYVITKEVNNITENHSFKTPARQLFVYSNVAGLVDCDFTLLLTKENIFSGKYSGVAFISYFGGLTLGVHQYDPPIVMWSYLTLPASIIFQRAVINPQSIDQQCFKWAILARHVSKYRHRVSTNYFNEEHRYDFSVLSVPTTVSEITLFERANPGTSVNVYSLKYNRTLSTKLLVYPLRVTDEEMPNHFDLLLIAGPENQLHYTYISNFSRLVSSQINKCNRPIVCCKKCFKTFDSRPKKYAFCGSEALAQHRLVGNCVFNPNTALMPFSPNS
ncbi:unnamed protein product [Macrosiphum euphorbiae]|nr:unnamed protein product [Macrosiphum euphorbiae]